MHIEQFLKRFQFDLVLADASVDVSLSVSRRVLASMCLGTEPDHALRAVSRVSEVLIGLSQGRDAIPSLILMLEDGAAHLERAVYFAQAGRGVGKAIGDLDWLIPILAGRVELGEQVQRSGGGAMKVVRAFTRREEGLPLKVDAARISFASSLAYWGGVEAPLSELDHPLAALCVDPAAHPFVRVLAGLCIGVGIDDAFLSVSELSEAMEDFWKDGRYVGGRLSAILANECDDFQRALYFASVGRSRPLIKEAFKIVIEALRRRAAISKTAADNGELLIALTSPYVVVGAPESCVYDLGFKPEDRDRFLHNQC